MLVLALALCLFAPAVVFAQPPAGADTGSSLGRWYRSLEAPNGSSCCSEADCRPVEARLRDGGWEIRPYGTDTWTPVPPRVVLKRENVDGRPIACILPSSGIIMCFVPPAGT